MKKILIFILIIVIIIVAIFSVKYFNYKAELNELKKVNAEYEAYLNKEIYGTDIGTVINKAVDSNEKNSVPKDEQGFYIQNDTNSIKIEIKIIDNDTTYQMETLYSGGMTTFVQYYSSITFECTEIEYNSKGRVNYMLFEQRTM